MFSANDEKFMQKALQLAKQAQANGEVPVGAVLTLHDEVIAEAYNQPIHLNDPTAHAEILVMRQAAEKLNNYRLNETTLYVTLEPCSMCAGAMVHARVKRLVYAVPDWRVGAAGSVLDIVDHPALNHRLTCQSGLCNKEAKTLLQDFFKANRL